MSEKPLPPDLEKVVKELAAENPYALDAKLNESFVRRVLRRAGVADLVEERNRLRRRDCGTEDDVCLTPNTEPLCHACDYARRKEEERDALREERDALDWWEQVRLFHEACGIYIGTHPEPPTQERIDLRFRIIEEEYREMLDARDRGDLVALADGMADVIVTVLGTSIEYGIDLRPVMDEVNRSNLAKSGGPKREDGKVLKPDGWEPPDVAGCIERQLDAALARKPKE